MIVTKVRLKNWKNFKEMECHLGPTNYIVGPNASGKSNFLDVFRFMHDVCQPEGGGLQKAVKERGGISRLRCFHHGRDAEILLEFHFANNIHDTANIGQYVLAFREEKRGDRIFITREEVKLHGTEWVLRPDQQDRQDDTLLTETHLEQTLANRNFRIIRDLFSKMTHVHLIPQLLKHGSRMGGQVLDNDPFGQSFLQKIADCPKRTRDARLRKIGQALSLAVPQFKELRYQQDALGRPHLEALYEHGLPETDWHNEEYWSDGTLRLLGMFWSLLESEGLLLVEEPEISLHESVIEKIPQIIERWQRKNNLRQVVISTHSSALLHNPGIHPNSIIVLEPSPQGTIVRSPNETERMGLAAGLSVGDVILPQTKPPQIGRFGFWE